VPRQKNGFDCGLFTCRYAFGIYKVKDQSYTYEDVFKSKTPLLKKLSNNAIFLFNQKVVDEFRTQLGKLCDNLHHVYRYNKVPHPSIGVTRRRGATRKSAPGKNKKPEVIVEDAKSLDSAAELEYASPIIDLVRCNNRIIVPAPSVSVEAVIPKVNLNTEVLQLEIKALVPDKPDVITEQKALEPAIDVKTVASTYEQKMLAQPLDSNNKLGMTMEQNLLEPTTDIKPIETNNEVGTTLEPNLKEPATDITPIENNNLVGTTLEPNLLQPTTDIKPIETNNKVGMTLEPNLLKPATYIKPIENNNIVGTTFEPKLPEPATDIKPIETNYKVGTTLERHLLVTATDIKPIETNNKVGTTLERHFLEPAADIKPIETNNKVGTTLERHCLEPAADIKPIETNNEVGTTMQPKALDITNSNASVGWKVAGSKSKRSKATLVGSDQSSGKIKKKRNVSPKKMRLLLQLIHL
jgi:hypothetical protein